MILKVLRKRTIIKRSKAIYKSKIPNEEIALKTANLITSREMGRKRKKLKIKIKEKREEFKKLLKKHEIGNEYFDKLQEALLNWANLHLKLMNECFYLIDSPPRRMYGIKKSNEILSAFNDLENLVFRWDDLKNPIPIINGIEEAQTALENIKNVLSRKI